jgi:PAS domain S-box-containing protein
MSESVIGVAPGAGAVIWTLRRVLMVIVVISSLLVVGTLVWVSANYQRFAIDTQNASTSTIATFLVKQRVFQEYRGKVTPFVDEWARLSTLTNGINENDPAKARIAAERIMQTLEVAEGRIRLRGVVVYTKDMELFAAAGGAANENLASRPGIMQSLKRRSLAEQRQKPSFLWQTREGRPVHSIVAPIGGFRVLGFVEFVTDPVPELAGMGDAFGGAFKLYGGNGKLLFESDETKKNGGEAGPVRLETHRVAINGAGGAPWATATITRNLFSFKSAISRLRNQAIGIVAGVVLVSILFGWLLLRLAVFSRLSDFALAMEKLARGEPGATVPATGPDEFRTMGAALETLRTAVMERDRAQEETTQAWNLLTDAIESTSDGFIIFDEDDKFVLCNEQYKNILPKLGAILESGLPYKVYMERAYTSGQFPKSDMTLNREAVLEQHRNPTGKAILRQTDAGIWIQCTDRRTSGGGWVGVRTDVTEIMRAEEELARSKDILETTFNSVDQGILMVDGDYRIASYNQRFAELLELPEDILDGNPLWADGVRYSAAHGEYEYMGLDDDGELETQIDRWIEERQNLTEPATHNYRRPNGAELEIWTNPLAGGGWVQVYSDVTERNRAETALRESEEKYVLVNQATRDSLFDWDLVTDKNDFPHDEREELGLQSWDRTGAGMLDRIHPDDQAIARDRYIAALKGEDERFLVEFRLRNDKNDWIWLHIRGLVLRDADGRAIRMIGSTADITDRKEAEEAVIKAQAEAAAARDLLTDAIESIPDGFIVFDSDDKFVLCNEQYKDILPKLAAVLKPGITYEKFREETTKRKQFADDDTAANRASTIAEHNNPTGQAILRLTDTGVWVQCKDRRTRAGGVVGVRTDVTDIKHAQEELARSKEILETTMNSVDQGIVMINGDHKIIANNRRYAEIVWLDPVYLESKPLWVDMMRKAAEANWFGKNIDIEELIQAQLKIRSAADLPTIHQHPRSDGTEFEFWSKALSGGGWVQSVTDVTDRLAAENILMQAKEDAEAAAEAKSEIVAMVSHEVRTPMNGVLGMARALLETSITDEQRGFADTILRSGENMIVLLNDLLDSSKMEAGRLELEIRPFDPAAIVEQAVSVLGVRASEKKLQISTQFEDGLPAALLGDGSRVQQILNNLVSNAIKFTQQGSVTVALSASAISGEEIRLEIAVSDTGTGISAEAQEKLFTPYMQGSVAIARLHGGTGLGLAICRQLADLMAGEIELESTFGEGSIFRFIAPFKIAGAAALSDAAPAAKRTNPVAGEMSSLRILLAEDNDINRQVVIRMLEKQGHAVTVAHDGVEALAVFSAAPFDIVLMDRHMPRMNGLDATRRIRAMSSAKASIPVIGVTAAVNKQEIEACLKAGMNDVVSKPVDPNDLQAALTAFAGIAPIGSGRAPADAVEYETQYEGDQPVIDRARLDSLRSDLGDVVAASLAIEFRGVGEKLFVDLKRAALDGDEESFQRAAHTLKSSASTVGLARLAKAGRDLELGCVNGAFEQVRGQTAKAGDALAEALAALAAEDWNSG